jgi:hypothetical protein
MHCSAEIGYNNSPRWPATQGEKAVLDIHYEEQFLAAAAVVVAFDDDPSQQLLL